MYIHSSCKFADSDTRDVTYHAQSPELRAGQPRLFLHFAKMRFHSIKDESEAAQGLSGRIVAGYASNLRFSYGFGHLD